MVVYHNQWWIDHCVTGPIQLIEFITSSFEMLSYDRC